MSGRLLSKTAFPLFYASNRVVIVSRMVAEALSAFQPLAELEYLVLDADGALYAPGETPSGAAHLSPIGAPVGVKALVVDADAAALAHQWRDWIAEQTGRTPPKVFALADGTSLPEIYAAIAECMIADSKRTRAQSARTERDLVALRWDYEQSLINLEKARRVIRGAGFDTRYATMAVPVGTGSVGPEGKSSTPFAPFKVRYAMPCDAAGLVGISLHFANAADKNADGSVTAKLIRVVDQQLLGVASLQYAEIKEGWTFFELERPIVGSFGDCELTLEWHQSAEGSAPRVSLSDMTADARGGETHVGSMPAMQIWSGFTLGELSADGPLVPLGTDKKQADFADLLEFGSRLDENEQTDIPDTETATWIQTHLQADAAVGVVIPAIVPTSASSVEVTCETAHEAGPPALYMVAVYDENISIAPEVWSDLLQDIKDGKRAHTDVDEALGIHWSVALVTPGNRTLIEMTMPQAGPAGNAYSLACAVMSATGEVAYGWCRWHDIKVAYKAEAALPPAARYEPALVHRMRSVKFPEIGEQLEYLAGQAKLHQQAIDLGFSPMIVAEDNGSLQTHPLMDSVSAALYRGGAKVGTTRVACDVETAHERSPIFCYILLLLPASVDDKYAAVEEVLERQLENSAPIQSGVDDQTGAHFFARQLEALDVKSLVIELDEPLTEPHDIVAAAVPVQGIVSYGWCRWLSLSISSAIEMQPEFSLSAKAD